MTITARYPGTAAVKITGAEECFFVLHIASLISLRQRLPTSAAASYA